MTEINYTHILLDAIYEHSKFSSKFIVRECLKANEKHIDNEEFYSSLFDVVNFFETKINEIYVSNLNRYHLSVNEDKLLPNKNKTYYPKPEIEGIGIPLFGYYNKYSGHIFIIDLIIIKSIITELSIIKKIHKVKKISAPTVAVFCQIINHSGILKQGELSNEDYCKKIILQFKINANPSTARKHYNQNLDLNKTSKRLKEIDELILPNLSKDKIELVRKFINNHTNYYS
jgi:hypothetical protein